MTAEQGVHSSNRPIGVFDSGVGGLSVLRALRAELPDERFVYVSDSGHAPYGERDEEFVLGRALSITKHLREKFDIKALVIACNTATAAAGQTMRNAYPDIPIIGIEPAIKPAAAISKTHRVGVMSTRTTLQSEKFRNLLALMQSQHPETQFILQPCDGLADAIERADADKIESLCTTYTHAMGLFGTIEGQIDTLVLGCTHYPFAQTSLRKITGPEVTLIEPGAPVARHTRNVLSQRNSLTASVNNIASQTDVLLITTGDRNALQLAADRWLHCPMTVTSDPLLSAT